MLELKNSTGVYDELIEDNGSVNESAAGGLHKYANPSLAEQEKDAWRKMAVKKHVSES